MDRGQNIHNLSALNGGGKPSFLLKSGLNTNSQVLRALRSSGENLDYFQPELSSLLLPKAVNGNNLTFALEQLSYFLEKELPGYIFSGGFSENNEEGRKLHYQKLEEKYGIKVAQLITYLYESSAGLNYRFFGTFRGLDETFSTAQTIGKDGEMQPNKKTIQALVGSDFVELSSKEGEDDIAFGDRIAQFTGGMRPGYITPFVPAYTTGGLFSIIFDEEAIKNLLEQDKIKPVFVEIVRGKQEFILIPLRFLLTFMVINGIYTFPESENFTLDFRELVLSLSSISGVFDSLDTVSQDIKGQNAFQKYFNLKKALKAYIKVHTEGYFSSEIVDIMVENFFRDFWNVEINLCVSIAKGVNIQENLEKFKQTEYFKYLIPEGKRGTDGEIINFIQNGFNNDVLKNLNLGESTETAKTKEYFSEQNRIVGVLIGLVGAGNIKRISDGNIEIYIDHLRNALEMSSLDQNNGLTVEFQTRKNIVENLINMFFGGIIKAITDIRKMLELKKEYFIGQSFDFFTLYFGLELSSIVSNPLYKEVWQTEEDMLKYIFCGYFILPSKIKNLT